MRAVSRVAHYMLIEQLSPLITLALILLLAFFAHKTTSQLFTIIYRAVRSEKIALYIVCFFYLPGTFLHEVAHLLTGIILFLKVTRFTIIPVVERTPGGYGVKLGSVTYIQRDPLRGFLVGIAPIFFGVLFFYFLPSLFTEFGTNIIGRMLVGYGAFVVASTMVSSKQDLREGIYMIPLLLLVGLFCYIFQFNPLSNHYLLEFVSQMNYHLSIALLINIGVYAVTAIFLKL